jgi:hypothetical protein
MYAKSGAYKNLNSTKMNMLKTNTNLRLIAICLVTFSLVGSSCTSLQEASSIASDDLYSTPNQRTTIASNKRVVTTEDWSTPNSVQNNASAQQNKNNNQSIAGADNEEYQDYQNYQDDRYLRLKVANRNRWSSIDDWGYWNDPRFNNAFYPSYVGWNSWYTGYYGASWYYPFGPSYTLGWGGYNPYSSFGGYGMGWGFNDFGFGYDPFGYGGFGYGGFGYGGYGFGYGGWNPYFVGLRNPYRPYYHGGNFNSGYGNLGYGGDRQQQIATRSMQNSAVGLGAYRNNRGYNNSNNAINNNNNNNLRNTVNPNVNSNFGSLIKRVVTNNANVNNNSGGNNGNGGSSYDRPARYFSNNNNSGNSQNRANYSAPTQSTNSFNSINSGGRSGGFNSSGSSTSAPRPSRGQNP